MFRSTWLALLTAVLLASSGSNCSQLSAQDRSPAEDADAWSNHVRSALQTITADDLNAKREQTKQELTTLLTALEDIPDGGWIRRVLQLDDLEQQLDRDPLDVAQLRAAYDRLRH